MRRALGILLALLLGVGAGLAYAWVFSPRAAMDVPPRALHSDFKDRYRALIAAAYAATGSLPRAEARLNVLGDADPRDALQAQAQRMLANPQPFERAEHLVALASALEREASGIPVSTSTLQLIPEAGNTLTPTLPLSLTELSFLSSETPEFIETGTAPGATLPAEVEATMRPTLTLTPEPGEPFTLTGEETICDSNLPAGLLQVITLNRSRRQLAGMEIIITWEGGRDQFFTGLKPELGNGYADYGMTPDTVYSVQLARGSEVASGLTAPTCQSDSGETFLGGVKLTFQQP